MKYNLILNPSPFKGEGLFNSLSLRRRGIKGEVRLRL